MMFLVLFHQLIDPFTGLFGLANALLGEVRVVHALDFLLFFASRVVSPLPMSNWHYHFYNILLNIINIFSSNLFIFTVIPKNLLALTLFKITYKFKFKFLISILFFSNQYVFNVYDTYLALYNQIIYT